MGAWNLNANVAGVATFEPGSRRIPEGVYAVQITDSDMKQSDPSKAPSLHVQVKITEPGEAFGMEAKIILGTDFTKEFNKKHLRAFLLGIGAPQAALDAGAINLSAADINGKTAFVFVEAVEGVDPVTNKKLWDNRNFIAKAFYDKYRAEHAVKPAGNGAVAVTPALGAAPAPAAGGFGGGALFSARS